VGLPIVDVPGVNVVFVVVWFRLEGAGLAKDFAAQCVGEKRLHIGRIRRHYEVQQICCGRVVGDEVRGCFSYAKVQYLDSAGPFTGGNLTGALGNLLCIPGSGNQDADRPVQDLVHTIQHQIVVVRSQYSGCDLVAAAQY
jgi:hypothetical protein